LERLDIGDPEADTELHLDSRYEIDVAERIPFWDIGARRRHSQLDGVVVEQTLQNLSEALQYLLVVQATPCLLRAIEVRRSS
jgi:hypothetical protein